GNSRLARTMMIAITTSNSIRVKPATGAAKVNELLDFIPPIARNEERKSFKKNYGNNLEGCSKNLRWAGRVVLNAPRTCKKSCDRQFVYQTNHGGALGQRALPAFCQSGHFP